MMRLILAAGLFTAMTSAALAHFVYVVPNADGKTLDVFFSETLEEDAGVELGPVAKLKLTSRGKDAKDAAIELKVKEHCLTGTAPLRHIVFGSLDYGLMDRGGKVFMLKYHPKSTFGTEPVAVGTPAELVAERTAAGIVFIAHLNGKVTANVEVTVLLPDGKAIKATTDAAGRTRAFERPGQYGAWARVVETTSGEFEGKKYTEVRHYPTLVTHHSPYPAMPEAVSSFGAAVLDGYAYAYGGHRAKVHSYDTEAVTGGWRRIALKNPGSWEELPAGAPLQGLALVAHGKSLYRLGGMAPRNAVGTKADSHSTAECSKYDVATKTWSPFAAFPVPRSSHDASVVGSQIVVIGGWNMRGTAGNDWCDTALMLDLNEAKPTWVNVPQPFQRRALQTVAHGGKVYVVGGLTDDGSVSSDVEIFDPATRAWAKGPELPGDGSHAGFNPATCVVMDQLIVSLGDGNTVRLSADGKSWQTVTRVRPRIVHRMVPVNGTTALLLGGATRGTNLDWAESVEIKAP